MPLVEELGHGVGAHPGAVGQDACGLGGGGDAEHRPPSSVEVVDGSGEGGGLAGASGSDDEHHSLVAGDGAGGVGLEGVESGGVHAVRQGRLAGSGVLSEGEDALLLVEDRLVGEVALVGSTQMDRPSDARTIPSLVGSRAVLCSVTWRTELSRASSHWAPEWRPVGGRVSQRTRITSIGSHVDDEALS